MFHIRGHLLTTCVSTLPCVRHIIFCRPPCPLQTSVSWASSSRHGKDASSAPPGPTHHNLLPPPLSASSLPPPFLPSLPPSFITPYDHASLLRECGGAFRVKLERSSQAAPPSPTNASRALYPSFVVFLTVLHRHVSSNRVKFHAAHASCCSILQ